MLLTIGHGTEQLPIVRNYLALHVSSTKAEKSEPAESTWADWYLPFVVSFPSPFPQICQACPHFRAFAQILGWNIFSWIFAPLFLHYSGVSSNITSSERHSPSHVASTILPQLVCHISLFLPQYHCSYSFNLIISAFCLLLASLLKDVRSSEVFQALCYLHLEQELAQSKCSVNICQITGTQMQSNRG